MTRHTRHLLLLVALLTPNWLSSDSEEGPRLADRHWRWLLEVASLITPEEREAFEALDQDYRRDAFVERFWRVRDPHPETARNEFRDLWEARRVAAEQRFGTLADLRSQVFLLTGEPATRLRGSCPSFLLPIEVWSLSPRLDLPRPVSVVFVKELRRQSSFRIWSPEEGVRALLLGPAAMPLRSDQILESLERECPDADTVLRHLDRAVSPEMLRHLAVPEVGTEWVAAFVARSTEVADGSRALTATLDVGFPGRHRSRTIVQATVSVPVTAVPVDDSEEAFRFLFDGEVLRRGELFESFRYRFDLPRDSIHGGEIPLVVQRFLRPGPYTLIVRVEDLVGQSFYRASQALEVPVIERRPALVAQAIEAEPPRPGREGPMETPAERVGVGPEVAPSVTLLRPARGLHTGKLRVHARTTGEGIAKVAFELNGKRLMSKRREPWSIEVDLGKAPTLHTLKAIALDEHDEQLASDEITVNAGPQRFAVRLVEPEPGHRYKGRLQARAVVDLPRGSRLDRLEFFLNETLLSTLYQPPYVQRLPLPDRSDMAYVRAVAYLEDGHSTEALVFINAPEHLDEVNIDLVELYTTVVDRRGRPVEGLEKSAFDVFENKVPQTIRRFERAQDLPFHAAVVIDTSTSMAEELRHAEEAALAFFQNIVTARDRAAVVTFNDRPRLIVPFTNSLEILAGGLAGMEAEGETALHDSVVFTLYHFGGLRGQRALILLSDGQDSISRYSFADALNFARETGVAIYTIGLDIPTNQHEARSKLMQLCRETGGQHFFIHRVTELDRIYQTIERELRSQYLIAYQSSLENDPSFRKIEVRVEGPSFTAKTIRGYQP